MSDEEISRGHKAKLLLDEPLIKEAFDKLEALYKEEIFLTKVDEDKERTNIYLCYNTLTTVKAHLQEICLLYTSPSPRDATLSRMPSSA